MSGYSAFRIYIDNGRLRLAAQLGQPKPKVSGVADKSLTLFRVIAVEQREKLAPVQKPDIQKLNSQTTSETLRTEFLRAFSDKLT